MHSNSSPSQLSSNLSDICNVGFAHNDMKGQILSLSHKIITWQELSQVLETTGSPVVKDLLISDRSNTELNTSIKINKIRP